LKNWFVQSVEDVCKAFNTDSKEGLSSNEAKRRLDEHGKNELKEKKGKGPLKIFLSQFASTIIIVLLIAALITGFIGEIRDMVVISIILLINAFIGFSQEYRAEKAMSALKKLSVPKVTVIRDGEEKTISAKDIVVGDLVFFEAGDYIPADMRLVNSKNLKIQESALTGESEGVEKHTEALENGEADLADRKNMAYSGTAVTYGRGAGIVTATGMDTEIGKIASMIQSVEEEETPMQKRLDRLGNVLAAAALIIVTVIFLMGLLRGEDLKLMFMTAVSFAVAAVPESLPTVVTIALALGARRMLKRNALIRKLMAVETLGSVNTICSDKTGTITENKMRVTILELAGNRLDFGREDKDDPDTLPEDDQSALNMMLVGGTLCNDAIVKPPRNKKQQVDLIGDPTEGALLYASKRIGIEKEAYEDIFPRIHELPFDSKRKRMTTIHTINREMLKEENNQLLRFFDYLKIGSRLAITKGAIDILLERCDHVLDGEEFFELDDEWRKRIIETHDKLASNGMRVLGIAYKNSLEEDEIENFEEKGLTFLGIFGMMDPAREGVKEAVKTAQEAGIRPIMITGDHPLTAGFIAKKLDIIHDKSEVVKGNVLSDMSEKEIDDIVREKSVFARVSPENKIAIVNSLKREGNTVAMTGDGVNDAPALKSADIGIAMGITGTDVSKEVSDMVLLDDNFSTIVAAVKEGRTIFDNVQKFIKYILASNIAEIWIMLMGPFLGLSLPLLPLQILWVNLVSDGLPALAISLEPPEKNIMKRKPNPVGKNIVGASWFALIFIGLIMAALALIPGISFKNNAMANWRTILFSTLVFSQLFFSFTVRSNESVFKNSLLRNPYLLVAVLFGMLLQLSVIYVPLFQNVFSTTALNLKELLLSLFFAQLIVWVYELYKLIRR